MVTACLLLKTDYQDPRLTSTVLGVNGYVLMKEDVSEVQSIEGRLEDLFDRLKIKLRDHLVVVSEEGTKAK